MNATEQEPWIPEEDSRRLTRWVSKVLSRGNLHTRDLLWRDAKAYNAWTGMRAKRAVCLTNAPLSLLVDIEPPHSQDIMDIASALLREEKCRSETPTQVEKSLAAQVVYVLHGQNMTAASTVLKLCDGAIHQELARSKPPSPKDNASEDEKDEESDGTDWRREDEVPPFLEVNAVLEPSSTRVIEIVNGDIMECEDTLAFEMSLDWAMNQGVMRDVRRNFLKWGNNEQELFDQRKPLGDIALLDAGNNALGANVYFLMTRVRASDDADPRCLEEALVALRNTALTRGLPVVNIPRLGMAVRQCLTWKEMCAIVNRVFRGSPVKVKLWIYNDPPATSNDCLPPLSGQTSQDAPTLGQLPGDDKETPVQLSQSA